ncbi:zf-HC2 domain-containing protein [Staphylococcus chromogenes]|nr:zf-HC2 domain-containing protein [Staphylococcus chromogenes]
MLDCASVQAALSARLDGEEPGLDDDLIDAHLSGCSECQAFLDRAASLNRQLTFATAKPEAGLVAPDLSEQILAGIDPVYTPRRTLAVSQAIIARIALILLGVLFIAWALRSVILASTPTAYGDLDPNFQLLLINTAAIRMAFGFALFFAAWKPRLAGGMLPIFAAVTMFSLGFGIRDVLLGQSTAANVWGWLLHIITTAVLAWAWCSSLGFFTLSRSVRSLGAAPLAER